MKTKAIQVKGVRLGEGMPKICVPLISGTDTGLLSEARAVKETGPDLVEWRADFYENLRDNQAAAKILGKLKETLGEFPLLFTVRTRAEGGEADLSVSEYCRICEAAAESAPDLMDVEVFGEEQEKRKLISFLQKKGRVVIASSHDFFKTDGYDLLLERFLEMEKSGADILKMAVMPRKFEDVTALLNATHTMCQISEKPIISMAMGRLGVLTRVTGEISGSALTFGTVGRASAPGQLPAGELRRILCALHGTEG